jgi:hypothetical protein
MFDPDIQLAGGQWAMGWSLGVVEFDSRCENPIAWLLFRQCEDVLHGPRE